MSTRSNHEPRCFVIMPFHGKEDVWKESIGPGVRAAGFHCERADKGHGSVMQAVVTKIFDADAVVADLSTPSVNVFYELGVAHTIADKTVMICANDAGHLPFDISAYRVIFYSPADLGPLRESLEQTLRDMRTGAARLTDSNPIRHFGPKGPFLVPYEKDRLERALTSVVGLGPPTVVVSSAALVAGRRVERAADATVVQFMWSQANQPRRVSPDKINVAAPEHDLIVVGSPRLNSVAEQLQRLFSLPCGYVSARAVGDAASRDTTTHLEPSERTLRIVTSHGDELSASKDHGIEGAGTDYGLIVIGTLAGGRRFVWLSGIHGRGTLGAYHCLTKYADQLLAASGTLRCEVNSAITQLVRVKYSEGSDEYSLDGIDAELLGDPVACHRAAHTKIPRGILFDLGDVVMKFDRDRTYRSIAHLLQSDYRLVKQRLQEHEAVDHVVQRYELGRVSTEQLIDWLVAILDGHPQLRDRLPAFWGDIFWPNYEMFEVLHYLKKTGMRLGMVSNTNELHYQHIEKDYPEIIDLFDTKSLSFHVGSAKPDNKLFADAIDKMKALGVESRDLLYVDDLKRHIQAIRTLGIPGFIYRSHSHFVCWLRAQGVYIPTIVEEPPQLA